MELLKQMFPLNIIHVDSWFCCSVLFGSWYDHVNGWWKKKQTHDKIHYMFYEDMIEVKLLLDMNSIFHILPVLYS